MSENDFFIEQPKIEGITESIINNLRDIVDKFGTFDNKDNRTRFKTGDVGLGYELYISTSLDGNRMLVIKFSSKKSFGGLELIKTAIGEVFWDKSLTAEESSLATKKTYEFGGTVAFEDFKHGKYMVKNIFSSPGTVFMVPPGKSHQDLLDQFDYPEKLIIVKTPYGYIVQHKDHLYCTEKRAKVVMQMFNEKCIDLNDVDKLGLDDILKMREEIQKRMEEQ